MSKKTRVAFKMLKEEKELLIKKTKETLDSNIALIIDKNDWHYAYGLIDMALALDLLTDDEGRKYKTAANAMRKVS